MLSNDGASPSNSVKSSVSTRVGPPQPLLSNHLGPQRPSPQRVAWAGFVPVESQSSKDESVPWEWEEEQGFANNVDLIHCTHGLAPPWCLPARTIFETIAAKPPYAPRTHPVLLFWTRTRALIPISSSPRVCAHTHPDIFHRAWFIKRACNRICCIPISPWHIKQQPHQYSEILLLILWFNPSPALAPSPPGPATFSNGNALEATI